MQGIGFPETGASPTGAKVLGRVIRHVADLGSSRFQVAAGSDYRRQVILSASSISKPAGTGGLSS
jgi:hypothetical protein